MRRIVKWIAIVLAIAVGLVAAFFGALVIGAILVVAALFALFGQGKFDVNLRRPSSPASPRSSAAPPPSSGDVIDIEASKVQSTRELK